VLKSNRGLRWPEKKKRSGAQCTSEVTFHAKHVKAAYSTAFCCSIKNCLFAFGPHGTMPMDNKAALPLL
jgi:hypothetical protein